ncbi:MAG: hypothetical protein LBT42_06215 [Tannerella sp.]|nr:hypothetical protein [Tannerella sp.]
MTIDNGSACHCKGAVGIRHCEKRSNSEIKQVIRIASQARKREITALLKLSEKHHLDRLEIVTYNEESISQESNSVIRVIPVWKWLLRKD